MDLTAYVEKHEFCFDAVLDEHVSNDEVSLFLLSIQAVILDYPAASQNHIVTEMNDLDSDAKKFFDHYLLLMFMPHSLNSTERR